MKEKRKRREGKERCIKMEEKIYRTIGREKDG